MLLNTTRTNITIERSPREMLDKLKSKILDGRVDAAATPWQSPRYIEDNPMFPEHSSNDTIDFVLGMDFPKVTKSPETKSKVRNDTVMELAKQ
jgi:hypothetical protein